MSQPITVKFSEIEFDLGSGSTIKLRRCDLCQSLVLGPDAEKHAGWHGDLTRGVGIAGMGFGGLGMGPVL